MDLIKCPICGEEYSPSYAKCPFCEEDGGGRGVKKHSSRRRVTTRRKAQSARGAMIAVLVVVLGVLGWYLFGGKPAEQPPAPVEPPPEQTVEPPEPIEPVNDDPFYEPAVEPPQPQEIEPEPPVEPTTEPPVEPPVEAVADVSNAALSKSDFTLRSAGETYTVRLTGTTAAPTWRIDDPRVATVAADGTVTAVANGSTTLRCQVGTRELTCVVRVSGASSGAAASAGDLGLKTSVGGALSKAAGTEYYDCTVQANTSFRLIVTGTDAAATGWTSDNTAVATVDANGNVHALAAGTARLTATVGGVKLGCIVRVR